MAPSQRDAFLDLSSLLVVGKPLQFQDITLRKFINYKETNRIESLIGKVKKTLD